MSGYTVAQLDQIDEVSDGRCPWRPIRQHFGILSFGANAFTAREAGDRLINEHDESEEDAHEELYLVQQGRARFELDGEQVDAPAGTFVFASPGVKRTAFAFPGVPPSGWEFWAPLNPLYEAGRYAEIADRGAELIAAHPEYPDLIYNLACCESLAGRKADAIEHLKLAIDGSPRFRSMAADDSDFDQVRDDPAFKELMG